MGALIEKAPYGSDTMSQADQDKSKLLSQLGDLDKKLWGLVE
jgi:hypothetical protein